MEDEEGRGGAMGGGEKERAMETKELCPYTKI